jgi:hypothetical protein
VYITTKKSSEPLEINVDQMPEIKMASQDAREVLEPGNLRGLLNIEHTAEENQTYKRHLDAKDSGKPGHYWGRDIMIEGQMPMAAFLMTPLEYGDDTDWFKDDKKFEDFMKRRPIYDWRKH